MTEQANIELERGKEYLVSTGYCFKTAPHRAINVGEINFLEIKREVFRWRNESTDDIKTYFVLSNVTVNPTWYPEQDITTVVSDINDIDNGSEIVLLVDRRTSTISENWFGLDEKGIKTLTDLIKILGEKI